LQELSPGGELVFAVRAARGERQEIVERPEGDHYDAEIVAPELREDRGCAGEVAGLSA
jgi:hypothetical protein